MTKIVITFITIIVRKKLLSPVEITQITVIILVIGVVLKIYASTAGSAKPGRVAITGANSFVTIVFSAVTRYDVASASTAISAGSLIFIPEI